MGQLGARRAGAQGGQQVGCGAGCGHVGERAAAQRRGEHQHRLPGVGCACIEHVDAAAVEEARAGHHLLERTIELGEIEGHEEGAHDLVLQVAHGLQAGDERAPVKRRPPEVRLAAQQRSVRRVRCVDRHADGTLALRVHQRRADRDEGRPALHEHRRGTAGELRELVARVVVVVERDAELQDAAVRLVEREVLAELVAEHLEEALDQQLGRLVVGIERLRDRLHFRVDPRDGALLRPLAEHDRHHGADARQHGEQAGAADDGDAARDARTRGVGLGVRRHGGLRHGSTTGPWDIGLMRIYCS